MKKDNIWTVLDDSKEPDDIFVGIGDALSKITGEELPF